MMCTRKKKLEEELEHIPLEEEIKKEIERIVEEMNYDDAIPERIYDPVEEERRIKEGELDRAKHLARKEGWSKGKIEGIAQGSLDKSIEIAKSMLEKNMNIELISELTNLSKALSSSLKSTLISRSSKPPSSGLLISKSRFFKASPPCFKASDIESRVILISSALSLRLLVVLLTMVFNCLN